MKILQTPIRFYPYIGGVEKHVYYLSKELVKLGHEVKVICANEPKDNIEKKEGIKIQKLPYWFKVANTNIMPSFPFKLLKEDFDIIHTHMPTPFTADLSVLIAKLKGKKSVLTYHNDLIKKGFSGLIAKVYNNTVLKITLSLVDKIIITRPGYIDSSKYLKKYKNKIEVLPNGVDLNLFKNNNEKRKDNLFFISVLDKYHEYKGLNYLINAMPKVLEKYPKIILNIAGEGELKDKYIELVKSKELLKNIKFLGRISDKELIKRYNQSKIFILPSIDYNEGFGIVALEAMSCKTPVIISSIVGVSKEVTKLNCGIVVEAKNENELSKSIINLLNNPRLAKQMGENGKVLVEKSYSWSKIANQLNKVYDKL